MRFRTASGTVPEVLAHDDDPGPVRLERDHRVELVGPVRHVGAVPGVESLRDPVQALQAHDVIDPQVGGVTEGAPEHADEVAVPVLPHPLGVEGRKRPVLPAGKEEVGRRPAVHARERRHCGAQRGSNPSGWTPIGEIGVKRGRPRRRPPAAAAAAHCAYRWYPSGRSESASSTACATLPGGGRAGRPRPESGRRPASSGCSSDEGAERVAARRAPGRQQRLGHGGQDLAAQARHLLVVHQGRLVRRREPAPELVRRQQPARLGCRGELGQRRSGRRRPRCRRAGSPGR